MKTGLYIQGGDERVSLEGDTLRVQVPGAQARLVPLEAIEQLVLNERTTLTGPVMGALRERSIAVTYLDWRGRLSARVEPHPSKNALIRRAQVEAANDPARSLVIARRVVRAKIRNGWVFLNRHERREGGVVPEACLQELRAMEERAERARSRDELMGVEGNAARVYFEGTAALLVGTGFEWTGRSRRPPQDPINALLSFGYALRAGDCADGAAAAGLDPYVGFLHAERVGRAELALDLMEELRTPFVDALVLSLIRRKAVGVEGFTKREAIEGGGVEMDEATRKRFLLAWSEQKAREVKHPFLETQHTLGVVPLLQARLLGKHCAGLLPDYVPYITR